MMDRYPANTIRDMTQRSAIFLAASMTLAFCLAFLILLLPPRYSLLIGVAITGMIVIYLRPLLGVFLLIILQLLRPEETFLPGTASFRLVFILTSLTFIAWFMKGLVTKDLYLDRSPQTLAFVGVILSMMISSLYAAGSTEVAWQATIKYIKILLLYYLIVVIVRSKSDFKLTVWLVRLITFYFSLQGVRLYIKYGVERIDTLAGGSIYTANAVAAVIILMIPIAYSGLSSFDLKERLFSTVALPIYLFTLVLTGSRAGFLAFACQVPILAFISKARARSGVIFIIIILAVFLITPAYYWERMRTISTYEQDASAMTRIYQWKMALKMFKDHPWTGVGFANFQLLNSEYSSSLQSPVALRTSSGEAFVCHNLYLSMLAEGGVQLVFFLLLAFWFVFADTRRISRLVQENQELRSFKNLHYGFSIGLLGFLVYSIFGRPFYLEPLYWLIALAVCSKAIVEKESMNQENLLEGGK